MRCSKPHSLPRLFQCCHPSHTVNTCSTWSTVPKACVTRTNSNAHVLVQRLLRWAGGMHCEYVHLVNHLLTVCIAGGANFHGKGSRLFRRNFRSFYFHRMNTGCSDHTPTSWLPCPIGEPKKHRSEWKSEEASFCNNGLVFLLCGGLCNYEIIKTAALGRNCHVEQKDSALLILPWQLQSVSYGFIGILYSSRLILLYSNHLEARQTIENHLVHMGTNLCRSMHIMTSSVAILVHFFLQFLFLQKQVYPGKLCTQWKFPAIRYRQNKTLEKHAWMTSICIWVKFKAWVVWLKLYKNWGFIVGRLILTLIYGTF